MSTPRHSRGPLAEVLGRVKKEVGSLAGAGARAEPSGPQDKI